MSRGSLYGAASSSQQDFRQRPCTANRPAGQVRTISSMRSRVPRLRDAFTPAWRGPFPIRPSAIHSDYPWRSGREFRRCCRQPSRIALSGNHPVPPPTPNSYARGSANSTMQNDVIAQRRGLGAARLRPFQQLLRAAQVWLIRLSWAPAVVHAPPVVRPRTMSGQLT
jgi:hypothetical protein